MKHLFTPSGETVLRFHPLKKLQKPVLVISTLTPIQQVLITENTDTFEVNTACKNIGLNGEVNCASADLRT